MPACVDELTEVLIFCDQGAFFACGQIDHVRIFHSLRKLAHREHIVPIFPQHTHYPEIATFVCQEVQRRDGMTV